MAQRKSDPGVRASVPPTVVCQERMKFGLRAKLSHARRPSALASCSPEQIALGRRWVEAWKQAAPALDRMRRQELRGLDAFTAISLITGPADYTVEPRAPKPTSGLIEQQRLFQKLARR